MDELIVEGPQATEFLASHGINRFDNFDLSRAKHYVPVTPAGHRIGDHIIFREREGKHVLAGRPPTANRLMFAAAGIGLSRSAEEAWPATANAALDAARADARNQVVDPSKAEVAALAEAVKGATQAYVDSVDGAEILAIMSAAARE